jgi:hypothetical protein
MEPENDKEEVDIPYDEIPDIEDEGDVVEVDDPVSFNNFFF